jgi:WD40 repeat protein
MLHLEGRHPRPQSLAFSPDGRLLAVGGIGHGIAVWDTRTGTAVNSRCAASSYFGWDVAFTPDARQVMLANGERGWVAIDPASGVAEPLAHFDKDRPQAMDRDGDWVVVSTVVFPITAVGPWRSVKLHAYRLAVGGPAHIWSVKADTVLINRVKCVPASDRIVCVEFRAFQAEGPTNRLTLVLRDRATGQVVAESPAPAESATALAVHPGGRWAAVCSGPRTLVWDLYDLSAKPRRFVSPSRKHVAHAAFSPDGAVLAIGGNDGLVTFWDPATGKPSKSFDWGLGRVGVVGFAPDGSLSVACGDAGGVLLDFDP